MTVSGVHQGRAAEREPASVVAMRQLVAEARLRAVRPDRLRDRRALRRDGGLPGWGLSASPG
jgi:hypothetical protein